MMNDQSVFVVVKGPLTQLKPGEKVLLSPTEQLSTEAIKEFSNDLDKALSRGVKFIVIDSFWKVIIAPEKSPLKFHSPEPLPGKDTVALLNEDHDLAGDSDLELAHIMERLCNEYQMCRSTLSTATLDVWNCIVRVAKEILKREGGEVSIEL